MVFRDRNYGNCSKNVGPFVQICLLSIDALLVYVFFVPLLFVFLPWLPSPSSSPIHHQVLAQLFNSHIIFSAQPKDFLELNLYKGVWVPALIDLLAPDFILGPFLQSNFILGLLIFLLFLHVLPWPLLLWNLLAVHVCFLYVCVRQEYY